MIEHFTEAEAVQMSLSRKVGARVMHDQSNQHEFICFQPEQLHALVNLAASRAVAEVEQDVRRNTLKKVRAAWESSILIQDFSEWLDAAIEAQEGKV